MINFLRIINNIKVGDYLHYDGTIDNKVSFDIIGVCVIPSRFLPDGFARFISLQGPVFSSKWDENTVLKNVYKKTFPVIIESVVYQIISPYSQDGSFNPAFLKDMREGNAFQDYMGYENTRIFKEKYGDLRRMNAFTACFETAPSYKNKEWYLPAIGELACIPSRYKMIRKKVQEAIDAKSPGKPLNSLDYWSSSEGNESNAWYIGLFDGYIDYYDKNHYNYIRAFLSL